MSVPNDICLFWYTYSPYARKIAWYLTLRGLAYAQCMQPPIMPRDDLAALNVAYRRIPVLTLGRDVLLDTRLILRVLERRFPDGALGDAEHGGAEQRAIRRLLERWTGDAGVFQRAVQLIPTSLPNMKDPAFVKDRSEMGGQPWSKERIDRARPEAMVHVRDAFELLESTLLADGRSWIFGTDRPGLADIEAVWIFHWAVEMPGALDPNYISANQFPHLFAYVDRFKGALKEAKARAPRAVNINQEQLLRHISTTRFYEPVGEVDANDPTGLRAGDLVTTWPTDSGSAHRETGTLLSLTPREMAISKRTRVGDTEIHVHMPRWGYRIVKAKSGTESAQL